MRVVERLKWARFCERPRCIPVSRPRGLKAVGLRYERAVGKAVRGRFGQAETGQWIEFEDKNGHGYCQPDVLVNFNGGVVVFEVKLTETEQARRQIDSLYRPVLEWISGGLVAGVVVVRHLTRESQRELVCGGLEEAITRAMKEHPVLPTLHWLGKGRI